ncbi:MAG: hypothetical protein ACI3Z8_07870 [Paludibacteraceae bacterium]
MLHNIFRLGCGSCVGRAGSSGVLRVAYAGAGATCGEGAIVAVQR